MGLITSRQSGEVEEVDIDVNHAYKYPPKAGNYFSRNFIMGGERFDTAQPEMYLFGENTDLNFLGSRPMPFPYPAPSTSEPSPSRTLRSLINVRKESLRFVRVPDNSALLKEGDGQPSLFTIDFFFDCDARCSITVMYFCTEEVTNDGLVFVPKDESMNSETFYYKKGANQQFSQVCHVFDPSKFSEEDLVYSFEKDIYPIVIYCKTEDNSVVSPQVHATIAVVERYSDGYSLKPLKQKLYVGGLCYLLQEIYGIENKSSENTKQQPNCDDPDENGAECVICMCDLRDTLILPCKHLCLCYSCADSLRYQANNCPICRAPFRALLQIKALQKSTETSDSNNEGENLPPGYEAVSLIEALNGPSEIPPGQNQTSFIQNGLQTDSENKSAVVEDSTTQTDVLNSCDSDTNKMASKSTDDGVKCRRLRKSLSVSSPVCSESSSVKNDSKLYRSESIKDDEMSRNKDEEIVLQDFEDTQTLKETKEALNP